MKLLIIENRFILRAVIKRNKKCLKKLLQENNGKTLTINNEKKWIKKFNKLTYCYPDLIEVGETFFIDEISIIKDVEVKDTDIIAICVEKNDLLKLKKFINHHRSIGIDKFVILDNNSNDGTLEWLLKQDDVVLLQTKTPYNTNRREGWINRIIAHYGYDKWYFVADSDELLFYNDCENKKIKDVIKHCEKNNIIRARAVMIDMYAEPDFYSNGKKEDYYEKCCYFDKNTYHYSKRERLELVTGGPRKRIFGHSPWLTKYPLFYFRKQDIECKSHFLYPHKDNLNTECNLVLKHYKFLPDEIEKYEEIVQKENYFGKSIYYKRYLDVMKKNSALNFMCEDTGKYVDSNSLNKINVYKKINWN